MFDNFLFRAVIAGIGVVISTAPLGCFMVWRRMAYFGDATAHAAILGVALSFAFSISIFLGVLIVSFAMAILVTTLTGRGLSMDSLLGVLSHSALAFGLVSVSFLPNIRVDLTAYLFGDILLIGKDDLIVIWVGAFIVCLILSWRWSALLTCCLNEDLAFSSNINPKREQLFLTICLTITIAVAIKVIGALLIGSLLIIPAATARGFSKTPEKMVFYAALIGIVSILLGIKFSLIWETPTGPTIVSCSAIIFFISSIVTRLYKIT